MKKVEITETQRGLKIKNGRITGILEPGRHWTFSSFGISPETVLKYDVNEPEFLGPWVSALIKWHPQLVTKYFTVVDTSDHQTALIYVDEKFHRTVGPGQRKLFWKILKDVRVEYIAFSDWQEIPAEQAKLLIHQRPDSEEFIHKIIPEGSIGLLFVDGRLVKKLDPGPCAYWKGKSTFHVVAIDMRTQNLEVSGQEILTKDRVSIRLNLDAHYRVSDAEKLVTESQDAKDLLYKELQFALRKAIGVRTLDEVLATKESLGTEVLEQATPFAVRVGIELTSTGVRDIILPGDIREILNQVVASEKQAQANLIRRREEVAATRSLLNTARLIESSPVLMRLKEMESIEEVSDKVQAINVVGGLEQLMNLVSRQK